MTKTIVYNIDDIFQDIEDDEENVLMNIPPEIAEQMGWRPGDKLKIEMLDEGGIAITKATNE